MRSSIKRATWLLTSFVALTVAVGCSTGEIYDPNDPAFGSIASADQLQIAVAGIYDNLEYRRRRGEITEPQLRAELAARTKRFASAIDLDSVPPADAWKIGDVLRTAEMWPDAEKIYRIAVKSASTTDRRVNDTLRLALCMAANGKVPEAVAEARKVFGVQPEDKAPILPAVLLEIAPRSIGKGHDVLIAKLLTDAIDQNLATRVDPATDAGKAFLRARQFHINQAINEASKLYRRSGQVRAAERMEREYYARLRVVIGFR